MPSEARKKLGRPTLFKTKMLEDGHRLGALGFTLDEIADYWNVNSSTVTRWARQHPEFSNAIKRGRQEADGSVLQSLLKRARDGDITGIIFWLKNRQPKKWRDKHDHELSGSVEHKHFYEALLGKAKDVDDWTTRPGRLKPLKKPALLAEESRVGNP